MSSIPARSHHHAACMGANRSSDFYYVTAPIWANVSTTNGATRGIDEERRAISLIRKVNGSQRKRLMSPSSTSTCLIASNPDSKHGNRESAALTGVHISYPVFVFVAVATTSWLGKGKLVARDIEPTTTLVLDTSAVGAPFVRASICRPSNWNQSF